MIYEFDNEQNPKGHRLHRFQISRGVCQPPGGGGQSPEAWLQDRLFENPDLLLAGDVDPLFHEFRPLAKELLLDGGTRAIDLFGISPLGGVVLVEVKLGRNSEARREIVAQALEYAGALRRLGYDGLERQLLGQRSGVLTPSGPATIYEAVGAPAGIDPAAFAEAVDHNLHLGRVLLILALDTVPPSLRLLVDDLRALPGLPFEIGIVEIGCYRGDVPGRFFMTPRLMHRMKSVERNIVRIDEARSVIVTEATSDAGRRTLTEEDFFRELAQVDPSLPERLRTCLAELEQLGVWTDCRSMLAVRGPTREGQAVALAYVERNGSVTISPARPALIDAGLGDKLKAYLMSVAGAIGGQAMIDENPWNWKVKVNGRNPRVSDLVAVSQPWASAIAALLE
ncbi:PDDEXK family nuclease [Neoroseomonas oryzicola]|uniref:DUF91 domain-containing protein n=1 Tax=Neoroseomonas oryzicola TaxID=535904 RepID=A0A9X9WJH7_9PROT|nr:hypothetical protein [Neoroseomonas oryzicola]MBR0660487.1 hypothetical protein [Neoroseomonas oryzicola]NKE18255.1 hypothetical protein [Neoroseomonas oryzicola]